jgi:hypothetical protein
MSSGFRLKRRARQKGNSPSCRVYVPGTTRVGIGGSVRVAVG